MRSIIICTETQATEPSTGVPEIQNHLVESPHFLKLYRAKALVIICVQKAVSYPGMNDTKRATNSESLFHTEDTLDQLLQIAETRIALSGRHC